MKKNTMTHALAVAAILGTAIQSTSNYGPMGKPPKPGTERAKPPAWGGDGVSPQQETRQMRRQRLRASSRAGV